jgi:hypothetical protein
MGLRKWSKVYILTKIPEPTTKATIINIASIRTTELGQKVQMILAEFGGELP